MLMTARYMAPVSLLQSPHCRPRCHNVSINMYWSVIGYPQWLMPDSWWHDSGDIKMQRNWMSATVPYALVSYARMLVALTAETTFILLGILLWCIDQDCAKGDHCTGVSFLITLSMRWSHLAHCCADDGLTSRHLVTSHRRYPVVSGWSVVHTAVPFANR